MLRRYQRSLVGGGSGCGFGLFLLLKMILGNEAKRRLIFYSLFCAKGMAAAGEPARAVIALLSFRRITITVLITRVLRLSLLQLSFLQEPL